MVLSWGFYAFLIQKVTVYSPVSCFLLPSQVPSKQGSKPTYPPVFRHNVTNDSKIFFEAVEKETGG